MPGESRPPSLPLVAVPIVAIALGGPAPARAAFTESAAAYGIAAGDGMSYGASFPDLDGDGDPDFYANLHWAGPGEVWRNESVPWTRVLPSPFTGLPDRHDIIWGDFDNDGSPDAYVNHGGDQNNELLWNRGGGIFVEGAVAAGVEDYLGRGREITLLDADNDGWLDIFNVNDTRAGFVRPSVLFMNMRDGTFFRFPNSSMIFSARLHVASADYDLDGDADLVTTTPPYVAGELWRNDGSLIWTNVAASAFPGIVDPLRQANGLSWADYDNDGDLDLLACGGNRSIWDYAGIEGDSLRFYAEAGSAQTKTVSVVATGDSVTVWAQTSDYQPVFLWYGAAGESTAVFPAKLAIADVAGTPPQLPANVRRGLFLGGYSVAAGDSLALSIGGPAAGKPLLAGGSLRTNGALLTWTKTNFTPRPGFSLADFRNRLYRNEGDGTFAEVTATAFDVNPSDVSSLAAAWGDYDNDGWLDVFIANSGNIEIGNVPNYLFRNNGDGTFSERASAEGVAGPARGMTDGAGWADVNGDGFLDLFVANGAEHPPFGVGPRELFVNDGGGNRWLQVQLRGTVGNGAGIGARVRVVTTSGVRWRWRLGESDNCFSDQNILHFGLGADATADTVQVFWPAGGVDTFLGVEADRIYWAVEGDSLRPVGNPHLAVPQDSLVASVDEGATGPVAWPLAVENDGGAVAVFRARPEGCDGSGIAWITVTPDTGGVWPGGRTVTVRADPTGLSVGEWCGRVVFTTSASAGPDTVVVSLTVNPVTGAPVPVDLPSAFSLGAPRPNPADGPIEVLLALPARGSARVDVVGVNGRRVATLVHGDLPAGRHLLRWDRRGASGARVASGVYFLRAETASGRGMRKITLVD